MEIDQLCYTDVVPLALKRFTVESHNLSIDMLIKLSSVWQIDFNIKLQFYDFYGFLEINIGNIGIIGKVTLSGLVGNVVV